MDREDMVIEGRTKVILFKGIYRQQRGISGLPREVKVCSTEWSYSKQ